MYNSANYIKETVESILQQTFIDYELIIVDDGSIDNSLEICTEFSKKDSRIIVVKQENRGASAARNNGIKHAKGDFITFMDSDDVLIGNSLYEDVLKFLREDSSLDVVQFDTLFDYGASSEHKRSYPFREYSNKSDIYNAYLSENIHVACWDKIFRRRVVENLHFPVGQTAEDIAIIPHIIQYSRKFKTVQNGYYGYIYRTQSVSHTVHSVDKIIKILASYYIFCNEAMNINGCERLAFEVYSNQYWMYLSYVRITSPIEIDYFLSKTKLLKLPLRMMAQSFNEFKHRDRFKFFIMSLFGKRGAIFFQKLFTGNGCNQIVRVTD